jgi:HD superfamily phosphohydrolase
MPTKYIKEYKILRDPVHGDIKIPIDHMDQIVDTISFQRLRDIEQSGMSPLYPSGNHNRFVHSVGVFHLARKASERVLQNLDETTDHFRNLLRNTIIPTFHYAALLHDIGHSPFSHPMEKFYSSASNKIDKKLENACKLYSINLKDTNFQNVGSKQHEMMSAYLLLVDWQSKTSLQNIDYELAVRMITGVKYSSENEREPISEEEQIKDIFINLLNGPTVDVDKLDYIIRDSAVAGINNVSIDVFRLFNGLHIVHDTVNNKYICAYNKSSFSVIERVVDGRTFLRNWVHNHHTVKYFEYLLEHIVKYMFTHYYMCNPLPEDCKNDILYDVFSADIFREPPIHINDINIYNLSDSNIKYLLHNYYQHDSDNEKYNKHKEMYIEYISRKPKYIPLWKSKSEYFAFFHKTLKHIDYLKLNSEQFKGIKNVKFKETPLKYFVINTITNYCKNIKQENIRIINSDSEISHIKEEDIKIHLHNKLLSYIDLFPERWKKEPQTSVEDEPRNPNVYKFFYIYIPDTHKNKKHEILHELEKLSNLDIITQQMKSLYEKKDTIKEWCTEEDTTDD